MKHLILFLAAVLCGCADASSDPAPAKAQAQAKMARPTDGNTPEECEVIAAWAGQIMEARQVGVEMADMMKSESKDPEFAALRKALVIEAYDSPRYSTEEIASRAVTDFKNDAYLNCIR